MAEPIGSVLTDEYAGIPGWGWGAIIAGAGAVTFVTVRYIRGRQGTASSTATGQKAASATNDGAGAGASGGGSGSGSPGDTTPPGGGSTTVVNPGTGDGTTAGAPGPKVNTSPPSSSLIDKLTVPIGAVLSGSGNVRNPVGYADAEQARNPTSYMPSPLDRLSERPLGIDYQLQAPIDNPSRYSTIYDLAPGDFPTAPAGATPALGRIYDNIKALPVGEKAIALPGGKYQVVN